MLKVCDGCKDGLDTVQIEMGHPLARNGAALAPFRANGAHPSYVLRMRTCCSQYFDGKLHCVLQIVQEDSALL